MKALVITMHTGYAMQITAVHLVQQSDATLITEIIENAKSEVPEEVIVYATLMDVENHIQAVPIDIEKRILKKV
jgi:CRISPR/Cas system-associated exonuclease Cas4 (RecB family)